MNFDLDRWILLGALSLILVSFLLGPCFTFTRGIQDSPHTAGFLTFPEIKLTYHIDYFLLLTVSKLVFTLFGLGYFVSGRVKTDDQQITFVFSPRNTWTRSFIAHPIHGPPFLN